jgi:hypothetical protein
MLKQRRAKMSERQIRYYDSTSSTTKTDTFTFNKSKKYKWNKDTGSVEEITDLNPLATDEMVISGSKSSLRRLGDLERNMSILASKSGIAGKLNNDTETLQLSGGTITGNLTISGNVYGSVFYDINNTAYYSNPANTSNYNALTLAGDLTVNGGDIVLGGTGRIQGIDTVSAATDAASKGYVDTAVANLVSAAPTTLDTLNELAAALGDDPNFATSVASSIATKVSIGAAEYLKGATVSNDTITFTRGDNTTFAITTSDANSNNYLTGFSFNIADGLLSATRTGLADVTVDLDGRYQLAGSYQPAGSYLTTTGKAADSNLLDGIDSSSFLRSDVASTSTSTVNAATFNATSTAGGGFQGIDADTATAPSFTWTADLNTGIYRPAADQLGITTGGAARGVFSATGLSVTGSITATGDVTAYSDERLKDNIVTIGNAVEKVSALRGVTFTRKEDGLASTGLIAQDVHAALPEAVLTDEDGMLSVKYGNLVGLLVEAIKELKAEIEELKNK